MSRERETVLSVSGEVGVSESRSRLMPRPKGIVGCYKHGLDQYRYCRDGDGKGYCLECGRIRDRIRYQKLSLERKRPLEERCADLKARMQARQAGSTRTQIR